MRRSRSFGVKARSTLGNYAEDFAWFKCHDLSGSNLAYVGRNNGTAVSGNLTIAGSPAALWTDNRGFATPEGDNVAIDMNGTFDDLFRLDTLETNQGKLLIMLYGATTTAQNANSSFFIWQRSGGSGSSGLEIEWRITTLSIRANVWASDTTLTSTPTLTLDSGVLTPIGFVLDMEASQFYSCDTGDWSDATGTALGATGYAGLNANFGYSVFAGHTSGGAGGQEFVNLTAGDAHAASLVAIRFPSGATSDARIANVYAEYAKNPREVLRAMF